MIKNLTPLEVPLRHFRTAGWSDSIQPVLPAADSRELPAKNDTTLWIVPEDVFNAHPERDDLLILPADTERDEKGRFPFLIGRAERCRRLFFAYTKHFGDGHQPKVFTEEASIEIILPAK